MQGGRGYVMDLLARPGRRDVAHSLLDRAEQVFRDSQVTAAATWLSRRHPYRGLFRRHGFFDARRPTGVVVTRYSGPHSDALDVLADRSARTHLMFGDSDAH